MVFSKVSGGWGGCRAIEYYLEVLVDLLADDSKVVWGKRGKFHCIVYTIIACLWDIHPVAPVMLKCWSNVPGLISMRAQDFFCCSFLWMITFLQCDAKGGML